MITNHHSLPAPPEALTESAGMVHPASFRPAPELTDAASRLFLQPGAPFENPDHEHLQEAHIAFLWTDFDLTQKGRQVLGTAEIFTPRGAGWGKARQEAQVLTWFGVLPDFLITLSAPFVAERIAHHDLPSVLALIDHELYHCGQAQEFGQPKFRQSDGKPVYCIRGHDVEQFTGVVGRWGSVAAGVAALVEAASRPPQFTAAAVAGACGTCQQKG